MTQRLYRAILSVLVILAALVVAGPVAGESKMDGPAEETFALGLLPSSADPTLKIEIAQGSALRALPTSVDLSNSLPPVGNQGSQGSCAGWATGYYYKTWQEQMERQWGTSTSDHQFSPAYIYNQRTTSNCTVDEGMTLGQALSIVHDQGIAPLLAFPYNVNDTCTLPDAQVVTDAYEFRADDHGYVFLGNHYPNEANRPELDILKGLLADNKPFVVGVPVYSVSFYGTGTNFLVDEPAPSEVLRGGHAMFVVGYDDNIGGFKVVNSWGTTYWGDGGFGYLSYDFMHKYVWEGWIMTDHTEAGGGSGGVQLEIGWNQIVLPSSLVTQNTADLFAPIADSLDKVWMMDQNTGVWLRFAPRVPGYVNTLQQVEPSTEIWVHATGSCTLDIDSE